MKTTEEIKKEFFNKLAEKLEDLFEKGEKCECGKRLPGRSKALSFNAYANIFFDEALTKARTQTALKEKLTQAREEAVLKGERQRIIHQIREEERGKIRKIVEKEYSEVHMAQLGSLDYQAGKSDICTDLLSAIDTLE